MIHRTDNDDGPRENPYAAPRAPLEPAGRTARRFSPLHFVASMVCGGYCTIYVVYALVCLLTRELSPLVLGTAPIAMLIFLLGVRQFRLAWQAPRRPRGE